MTFKDGKTYVFTGMGKRDYVFKPAGNYIITQNVLIYKLAFTRGLTPDKVINEYIERYAAQFNDTWRLRKDLHLDGMVEHFWKEVMNNGY